MLYIKNARVFLKDRTLDVANILVVNGKIQQISEAEIVYPQPIKTINANHLNVIPGFIDIHIHGANGADVMDATSEALQTMAEFLPSEGTTSFLATTITQAPENIEKALINVVNFKSLPGQAEIVGVHLEGPFVEESKAGAQPREYILKPNLSLFNKWQKLSGNQIKTMTMAPEHDPEGEMIRTLNEAGIVVSAGHTNANFLGIKQAVTYGAKRLTHLCNAMNGIHHRDVGAVGAAFILEDLSAELIADGIHVSDEMLEIIYNQMGSGRIIMITDAMRAKGLPPGDYELGGQPVIVTEDRAVLKDGTLAGSILKMHEAAQRMLKLPHVEIRDIIEMASVNPAKQVGIFERKGSIAKGKDADLLIVDDEMNIKYTICRGVVSYKEELHGNH